jgi:hypothetical protein
MRDTTPPTSSELPSVSLWLAAGVPVVSILGCFGWSCLAWSSFSGASVDTEAMLALWIFWATDLPFAIFAGATALAWLLLSAFFALRGHLWLVAILTLCYLPAMAIISIASWICARTKVFD